MGHKEVREQILKELYKFNEEHPGRDMHKAKLMEKLNLDDNKLTVNALYLHNKGLIVANEINQVKALTLRITAEGMDVVEKTSSESFGLFA